MKKHKTMSEVYGDGSNHIVCEKCGFCITCGDCRTYGCGRKIKRISLKYLTPL